MTNTVQDVADEGCMTAEDFLRQTEPEVLKLMLNPLEALQEDTSRAAEIAAQHGEGPCASNPDAFPLWVWHHVYPQL